MNMIDIVAVGVTLLFLFMAAATLMLIASLVALWAGVL
jgi:hypothetical protein